MKEKYEILEHIHQDSSMAIHSMEKLMEKLKDKDNSIKGYVEEILGEYKDFENESRRILEEANKEVSDPSFMAKMGSSMGIAKEVKEDNSDAAIAEMLIEGITMGTVEIEKKLKDYDKELDKEHKKLAKKFLKFQEKAIDGLKEYL